MEVSAVRMAIFNESVLDSTDSRGSMAQQVYREVSEGNKVRQPGFSQRSPTHVMTKLKAA